MINSTSSVSDEAPYGAYSPHGLNWLLIGASRHTVLGRGEPRRALWRLLRSRRQERFDVLVGDVRMRLLPFESSLARRLLLRPQNYFLGEFAFLRRCLRGGGTLVDVGANIGAISL